MGEDQLNRKPDAQVQDPMTDQLQHIRARTQAAAAVQVEIVYAHIFDAS